MTTVATRCVRWLERHAADVQGLLNRVNAALVCGLLSALSCSCGESTRVIVLGEEPSDPDVAASAVAAAAATSPMPAQMPPGQAPARAAPAPAVVPPPERPSLPAPVPAPAPVTTPEPWTPAPPLRAPIALPDAQLAAQALALLGSSAVGASGSCSTCHALGRPTLTRWATLTQEFASACPGDSQLAGPSAVNAMLQCFGQRAGKSAGPFSPANFGVYAAAARLPWFTFVFQHASGSQPGALNDFVDRVAMPRVGQQWTQAEFGAAPIWRTDLTA